MTTPENLLRDSIAVLRGARFSLTCEVCLVRCAPRAFTPNNERKRLCLVGKTHAVLLSNRSLQFSGVVND